MLCDIDGCIAPEDASPIDAQALAALAAHNRRAAEHHDVPALTLCSGRPAPFAEAISRAIANTSLPIICENGVWLYDPAANTWYRDPAIRPEHLQMVRDAVAWAVSEEAPLEVLGQGSKRALGRPLQTDHAVELTDLTGVTLYEPEELVLSARAGTPLAEIGILLAGHGQELAFEPLDYGPLLGQEAGRGTLGGVLAAKSAMEKHGIKGRLKFMGEPAEKVCGSKPVHAAKGYYD
ncbi:MAG: FAD-binding protein, partial [Phycisphaerales bacterium]|nr:FAD-binding protein [Phycisphaerales bacterium]